MAPQARSVDPRNDSTSTGGNAQDIVRSLDPISILENLMRTTGSNVDDLLIRLIQNAPASPARDSGKHWLFSGTGLRCDVDDRISLCFFDSFFSDAASLNDVQHPPFSLRTRFYPSSSPLEFIKQRKQALH
ncbi:hypothetical protein R1sor_011275 [Riccia sorocarpa]|uniref:Uncharacterized protein n=1 Tax=Riccia sorocarpa TaxID=122646 RepID=A0ABD3I3W3_9MARC